MTPSCWRVRWLLPMGQVIGRVGICQYQICEKKTGRQLLAVFATVLLLVIPGKIILYLDCSGSRFTRSVNTEKFQPDLLRLGDEILQEDDHLVVLGCSYFASTLRQKYIEPEIICSREKYVKDLILYRGKREEAAELLSLMNFANGMPDRRKDLQALLDKYGTEYVILRNDAADSVVWLEDSDYWSRMDKTEVYSVYRRLR